MDSNKTAPCLILSNIRYVSRVKWSNSGKGVAPPSPPRYSSYCIGIFISPEKPVLFLRFVKNKPYFNSSRDLVTAFEERKTNDLYVQQNFYTTTTTTTTTTINRVLHQMEQTTNK